MRPLVINFIGISIYLEYDSFPDDFRQFRWFFQNANGHTDQRMDGPTDGRTNGRTDPHIEMRGRI